MLVDVHSHIDRYTDKLSEALDQIEQNRILTISVAMDIESFIRATEISRLSKYLIPTFGIHPWEAPRYHRKLSALDQYLKLTPLIGESGLDFHFIKDASLYPYQQSVFEYQCSWAQRLSKSMNLHTKGAEQEVLNALRKYHIVCPIIHWYSGPIELIESYLQEGCYFTIGVEVLTSVSIQRIARMIPPDRLLLETDNPGGYKWINKIEGMPSLLLEVLAKVSELLEIDPFKLENQLNENWRQLRKCIKMDVNGMNES